jgi:hypothetical protein
LKTLSPKCANALVGDYLLVFRKQGGMLAKCGNSSSTVRKKRNRPLNPNQGHIYSSVEGVDVDHIDSSRWCYTFSIVSKVVCS